MTEMGGTMTAELSRNHDNPRYFDGSIQISNLNLLPDYSLLSLEGKTLLLIGGAISVDRRIRIPDLNYWKGEGFVLSVERLNFILESNKKIDIVVTHTAPAFPQELDQKTISFSRKDKNLIHELTMERRSLNDLYYAITKVTKPAFWYYGHFHASKRENIDGTKFCLLGIDEIKLLSPQR